MPDKILTISIAAYNAESTLQRAVASLLKEDVLDNLDIIIVNDGSTDKTKDIASSFVDKYPQSIRLINKENGGWGSTVNASLSLAKGKFFKLLDSDDYFETSNLKEFINYLKDCNSDIVFTDFDYIHPNKIDKVTYDYEPRKDLPVEQIKKILMHGVTIKTSTIQGKVILLEHCFYVDGEFTIKSLEASKTFSYLPIKIYNYVMGSDGQSVSLKGYVRHAYDHEKMLDVILPITKNSPKCSLIYENHIKYLPSDQLYIFMLDKKYKNDFFRYYKKLQKDYPETLKKMKIYVKLSSKSPIFYNFFSYFLSKKAKR